MKFGKKELKNSFLLLFSIIVLSASLLEIINNRRKIFNRLPIPSGNNYSSNKISFKESNNNIHSEEQMQLAYEWSQKLLKGGYILFVRHAEREKWLDVQMYDALESDLHNNGINNSRYAEKEYFSKSVCLSDRGQVQVKAMKEVIDFSGMPIGYVISSPSCRARQTADVVFGGHNELDKILVHKGPYFENMIERNKKLKEFLLQLPVENSKNTIVTAHNGVVDNNWFSNRSKYDPGLELEEGGFYIISNKGGELILEYEFNNFAHFARNFFPR